MDKAECGGGGAFLTWRMMGIWETLHAAVRELLGREEGREACPSCAVLDSQSVKTTDRGGPEIGYNGHKKVRGRKRHLLTDTRGLVLRVEMTAANRPEREVGRVVCSRRSPGCSPA